jgi:transposase
MLALYPDLDVVIGVDTHKDTHTAAAVGATGAVLEHLTVPADPAGYRQLIGFGRRHGERLWAIKGTGSFGAGLTTEFLASGERIVEVDRPRRPARRGGVKSDDIDAVRAARQALAGVGLSEPRRRGDREAIRMLLSTRAQAVTFRTRAISALHALVTSAPDGLRERLRKLPLRQLLQTCAGLRDSARRSVKESATVLAMRSTARRALACEREAAELEVQLDRLVRRLAPAATRPVGNRPVVADQLITSWSHHRRIRSEAAFAKLGGAARPSRPRRVQSPGTDSTGLGIDSSTTPSTRSCWSACAKTAPQGLRPASPRPGQDHPRHQAMPEALYRPTTVPPARGAVPNHLTRHRSVQLSARRTVVSIQLPSTAR